MKSIYDYQDWEREVTTVNGNDIERFYLGENNRIVKSEVLYHGKNKDDAINSLLIYWQPPKNWYVFTNNEIRYC